MPYEIAFTHRVPVHDRDRYINECCVGGDIVAERLLPRVASPGGGARAEQEDWGWFIWFRRGGVRLAVDIFTDDPERGEFRVHLTSRVKRFLWLESVVDTPELEALRVAVESGLSDWGVSSLRVQKLDARHMPIDTGQ